MVRFGFAAVTAALWAWGAAAQSVDVVVKGIVTDQTGAAVRGATVTARNAQTGLTRTDVSDEGGIYRLAPVPPGVYTVKGEIAGFLPQVRSRQVLHVGTTVTIDFVFDVVSATETVEVVSGTPLLETTTNTLSRLVPREELELLPVVDRKFNALASLAPGVTPTGVYGGVDISGSRDFQNGYYVDGVSAEGLGFGDQRVTYAQDWIQEFQILTSQYDAEFGGSSGGVLTAITRSGSNATTGGVYGFFRNGRWDATPAFADSKASLDMKRFGGTVGGKLIADRLFFFGGFEWYDNDAGSVVHTAFPELNGNVPTTADQKLYLVKLEHHSGESSTHRVRYNRDRKRSTGLGVGGTVTEEHGLSETYTGNDVVGGWSWIASASAFNELRAALSDTASNTRCNFAERNPRGTWFGRVHPGARLGCPAGFGRLDSNELQLIEELSWTSGGHDVKGGAQLSRGRTSADFRFLRDGFYNFPSDIPFSLSNPESYPSVFNQFEGPTTWDHAAWSWGVFLQDGWRVTPSLTVNVGVRYDVDDTFTALNRLVRVDKGLRRVREDRDNVAPRLGIAWAPFGGSRRTLLRAGAGVYYDENHSNMASLLLTNSILVDRSVTINAFIPGLNPFSNPASARRFLAEALARNTVPDIRFGGTADLEENLQVPYTIQASVGLSHEFGGGWSVSVDGVFARGLDQYVIRDVNLDREAALAGRTVRLNPNYTFINRYGNGGEFTYRALQLQAGFAPSARHAVRLSYTLAKNEGNTNTALVGTGGGREAATNPFDLDEDHGPTNYDVRHNLSISGTTTLPLGIRVSAIVSARSALPWSAVDTRQRDSDPFPDRPEPRNSRRGDHYFSLDTRLAKTVSVHGGWSATAFLEVFNLTNTTNYTSYVGTLGAAQFGRPTAALERRRTQLGLRLDF